MSTETHKDHAKVTTKKWPAFVGGLLVGLVLVTAHQLLMYAFAAQTKLSCHTLPPAVTRTEYCVYHTHIRGPLGVRNNLLIGPSPSRGIVYAVPYNARDIQVEWDEATDAAHIIMPHAELTIERGAYVDTR